MVCSHSRFIMARMIPSRMTGDLLAGMWELLGSLGAVPRRLIWDNETGIGRRNSYAAGVAAFAGSWPPGSGRSNPTTRRARAWLSAPTSSWRLPSCRAGSSPPEDFNNQLDQWLPKANARLVRRTGARPTDLLTADKAAMLALPPVPPVTGFTARVRLPRDYYVRMGSNDYSVHPQAIGRFVDVTADLQSVTISLDGRSVGTHPRSWGTGLTITDPDHVEAARALRKAFQTPQPVGETTGLRDLADYDRAFGVVLDDGQVA
jgi:hypothetical protein